MGKIIHFPSKQPTKFGFERVTKPKKETSGQLNMAPSGQGQVLRLPTTISPFEKALLLDEQEDSGAEKAYKKAVSEGDHAADAYCNLGIIESRAGRIIKAFDCFTKALKLDPRHFEAHYNLGNLYFEGDNMRMARMHYELAAEINPTFPNLCFNLGLALALLEETKSALDALIKYQCLASPEERGIADDLISGLRKSLTGKSTT